MDPEEGLEPSTHRLTADYSTIKIIWNARRTWEVTAPLRSRQRVLEPVFRVCGDVVYPGDIIRACPARVIR